MLKFDELGAECLVVDDRGDTRCFCDQRYAWSKYLPSVFANFLDRRCFFTGHDNWLTIELLDAQGNQIEYEIFFSLTLQGCHFLRLYVESAYVRDAHHQLAKPKHFKHRAKIKASVLLAKKLRGEPIHISHANKKGLIKGLLSGTLQSISARLKPTFIGGR